MFGNCKLQQSKSAYTLLVIFMSNSAMRLVLFLFLDQLIVHLSLLHWICSQVSQSTVESQIQPVKTNIISGLIKVKYYTTLKGRPPYPATVYYEILF